MQLKNLKSGIIYSIYENEKPVPKPKDIKKYNKDHRKISAKGNLFVTRACKCVKCGTIHKAKKLSAILCPICQIKTKPAPVNIVDDKLFEGLMSGVLYTIYRNEAPVPKNKDESRRIWMNKKSWMVSKNNNIFITKIALCTCGVKRVSPKLRNPLCFKCREKTRKTTGALSEAEQRREIEIYNSMKDFERKSREIYDCTKRDACLDKYKGKKFVPCFECSDYEKMDICDTAVIINGLREISECY